MWYRRLTAVENVSRGTSQATTRFRQYMPSLLRATVPTRSVPDAAGAARHGAANATMRVRGLRVTVRLTPPCASVGCQPWDASVGGSFLGVSRAGSPIAFLR